MGMKKIIRRRNEFYASAVLYELYALGFLLVRFFAEHQTDPWPFCSLFCVFGVVFVYTAIAFFLDGKSSNPCWFHLVIAGLAAEWVTQSLADCFFFQANDLDLWPIQIGFAGFFALPLLLSGIGFIMTKTGHGWGRFLTGGASLFLLCMSFIYTLLIFTSLMRREPCTSEETMGFVLIAFLILPSTLGFLSCFQNAKENPNP